VALEVWLVDLSSALSVDAAGGAAASSGGGVDEPEPESLASLLRRGGDGGFIADGAAARRARVSGVGATTFEAVSPLPPPQLPEWVGRRGGYGGRGGAADDDDDDDDRPDGDGVDAARGGDGRGVALVTAASQRYYDERILHNLVGSIHKWEPSAVLEVRRRWRSPWAVAAAGPRRCRRLPWAVAATGPCRRRRSPSPPGPGFD